MKNRIHKDSFLGKRTQHTPGPWLQFGQEITADNPRRSGFTVSVALMQGSYIDEGQKQVAIPDEEIAANASLIAAAPEMLEAIRYLLMSSTLDGQELSMMPSCDAWAEARRAIAKAEGTNL